MSYHRRGAGFEDHKRRKDDLIFSISPGRKKSVEPSQRSQNRGQYRLYRSALLVWKIIRVKIRLHPRVDAPDRNKLNRDLSCDQH